MIVLLVVVVIVDSIMYSIIVQYLDVLQVLHRRRNPVIYIGRLPVCDEGCNFDQAVRGCDRPRMFNITIRIRMRSRPCRSCANGRITFECFCC